MPPGTGQNVIELLLKAIDEASPVLKQVATGLDETESASKGAGAAGEQSGEKIKQGADKAKNAAKELEAQARKAEAALLQIALVAGTAFAGVVAWVKVSTDEYNKQNSAMLSLIGVARTSGEALDNVTAAAIRLSSDGLMTLGESARALRNLMATGYGLDEAVLLMERLRDSAAFGRQGYLTMGEAVVSATEGIKNGNSILVDNAGVTKNLSVMLKEAGLSAQDLMNSGNNLAVRQAILNGIVKETAAQMGDAARLSDTLAGAQSRTRTATDNLQKSFGSALAPALKAVNEAFAGGATDMAEWVTKHQDLVAAATVTVGTFLGLVSTVAFLTKGIQLLNSAQTAYNATLLATKLTMGEFLIVVGVIAAVVGGLTYLFGQQQREAQAAAEAEAEAARKAAEAESQRAQDTIASLNQVADTEKKVADARKQAEAEASREAASQIDWLYNHLVTALQRRYEAQKKTAEDGIQAEVDAATKAHDKRIAQIEEETKAFVSGKQSEIDAIDAQIEAMDRENAAADSAKELQDLRESLKTTSDPEQAKRIMEQIAEAELEAQRTAARQALEDKKSALQEEIDARETAAETEKQRQDDALAATEARLERKRQVIQDHFAKLLDDQRIQGEAEKMILDGNQAAMIEVLKRYAPEYFTLGKSFGERLIAGYVGKQPDFVAALDFSMNYVLNSAAIIKAAADKAEADARRVEAAAKAAQAAASKIPGAPEGPVMGPPGPPPNPGNGYTPSNPYQGPGVLPGDISPGMGQAAINIYGNVEVKSDRMANPDDMAASLTQKIKYERWAGVPG